MKYYSELKSWGGEDEEIDLEDDEWYLPVQPVFLVLVNYKSPGLVVAGVTLTFSSVWLERVAHND